MKEVCITEENEHFILLNKLYKKMPCNEIEKILDCGTGKTSLSSLLDNFKKSNIDAIVYYNDTRKIDSVNQNIKSDRIKLIEKDICKDNINKKYNLVLAHLLLGESITWGNTFENVLNKLINIDTDYLIIVDYKEDTTIDYDYLNKKLNEHFEIVDVVEQLKEIPQKFTKFEGITYIGYLLKKYK